MASSEYIKWRVIKVYRRVGDATYETTYDESSRGPNDKTLERASTIVVELDVDGEKFHRTLHGGAMSKESLDELIRVNTLKVSPLIKGRR